MPRDLWPCLGCMCMMLRHVGTFPPISAKHLARWSSPFAHHANASVAVASSSSFTFSGPTHGELGCPVRQLHRMYCGDNSSAELCGSVPMAQRCSLCVSPPSYSNSSTSTLDAALGAPCALVQVKPTTKTILVAMHPCPSSMMTFGLVNSDRRVINLLTALRFFCRQ